MPIQRDGAVMITGSATRNYAMAHNGLMSALDSATGQVRLISEVPSGAACQCVCAECRGVLIARKGQIRAHHFAHKQGEPGNASACQETALHNAAKRLLAYHLEWVAVPPVTIQRPTKRFVLPEPKVVEFKRHLLLEGSRLSLTDGDIEPRLETLAEHRPDAFAHAEEFGEVYFEVHVTHPVQEEKKAAYRKLGLWVMEIDLSECEPGQIGLERLKELVEREATRYWLSWNIPDGLRESLEEYETTVARLREKQDQAFVDDLKKPISRTWARPEGVLLKALRYRGNEYPVSQWIPVPTVNLVQGYWVTDSIGGTRLPVFWEPYKEALSYLGQEYRSKRDRALSYVLAGNGSMTIEVGDQTRLVAVMRWVLKTLATKCSGPIHHILGLKRHPNPDYIAGSSQMFREKWVSLWADPALERDDFVCAAVPEAFARACIIWGAAGTIMLADGKAFAETSSLTATGQVQAHGDVYTAIRLRCESLSPLPCRLILEEGGFSRSLNITRHLQVRDGSIYLKAMGLEIPTSLTTTDLKQPCPINLVPGLSYSDESALFRADERRLVNYLQDRLHRNPNTMSQYVQGDSLLASFVAYFQQRTDGI